MGWRKWIGIGLVLAVPLTAGIIFRPDRAIRVATGVVAHNVCSKTFVSDLDPQTIFSETIARVGLRRLRYGLRFHVDRTAKTVDASVAELLSSHAVFHDGLGCVLRPAHCDHAVAASRRGSIRRQC